MLTGVVEIKPANLIRYNNKPNVNGEIKLLAYLAGKISIKLNFKSFMTKVLLEVHFVTIGLQQFGDKQHKCSNKLQWKRFTDRRIHHITIVYNFNKLIHEYKNCHVVNIKSEWFVFSPIQSCTLGSNNEKYRRYKFWQMQQF